MNLHDNMKNSKLEVCFENVYRLISVYFSKIISIAVKYRVMLTTFCVVIVTPAFITRILENGLDAVSLLGCLVLGISVYCFCKSWKAIGTNAEYSLYLGVIGLLIIRNGLSVSYAEEMVTLLALAFAALIIFCHRKLIYGIPFICLASDFVVTDFVNDNLFALLAIIWLTGSEEERGKNDKRIKITLIIGCIVYIITSIKDYCLAHNKIEDSSMLWQYFNDYFHFGFSVRGLIATLRFIMLGNSSLNYANLAFIICLHIISIIFILFIIWWLWKRSNGNIYIRLLIAALICCEGFRNIASSDMIVFYDNTLICCLMLCIAFIINDRFLMFIPIVVAIAMCIHHGFAVFLFPALICLMVYRYLTVCDEIKRKVLVAMLITLLVAAALFAYFHFIAGKINKMDFKDACIYMSKMTGNTLPDGFESMDIMELLDSNGLFFVNLNYVMYDGKTAEFGIQQLEWRGILNSVFLWLTLIPVIALYRMNYKAFKKCDHMIAKIGSLALFLIAISYLEVDYGRWNGFLIMSLMIILLVTVMVDEKKSWLYRIPEKYRMPVCKGLIIYMIIIPNMGIFAM